MATTISSLRDGVKGVASHMESVAEHSMAANVSVTQMLKSMLYAQVAVNGLGAAFKVVAEAHPALAHAGRAFKQVLSEGRQSLEMSAREAEGQLLFLEKSAGLAHAGMETEHARLKAVIKLKTEQLALRDVLDRTHLATKLWVGTLVTGLLGARSYSVRLNQDLIEANSALDYRFSLMQKTLEIQRLTGESFEDITDAAKALVHYGMDERATFRDNLKYVTMLKEGIGLSAHTSGMLAAIWERQLGQSFRRAADTLAQIVNSTSLAADEAGRLATNIARAVGAMRPGVSRDLAAVVKLVAGYEDQLKKMGGEAGAFADLLAKMTRSDGLVGASVLGVGDPEFLASERAAKGVIQRFGSYVNSFLADTRGWERQLRLEALADQFGVSAEQVSLMARAVKSHAVSVEDSISIEERYREQVVATGRSWSTLGNKLKAVLLEAMLPLLQASTRVLDVLTQVVGWLTQFKAAVYVVWGGMLLALPMVIREVHLLTAALVRLALASRAAALASVTGSAGGAVSGSVLASLRSFLTTVLPRALAPILYPAIAVAAVVALLARIAHLAKQTYDLEKEAREGAIRVATSEEELAERRMVKFYVAARAGSMADAREQARLALATIKPGLNVAGQVVTERDVAFLRAQMASRFIDVARRAQVTQVLSEQSFVRTPEEEARERHGEAITDEMVKQQIRLAEEYRNQTKVMTREAEEQIKWQIFRGEDGSHTWWDLMHL